MNNSFIKIFLFSKKALILVGVSLLILLSCFFWHSCYKHFLNTFKIEKESLQSTRTKNSESLESKIVESFIYDSCNRLLVYIKKTPTMYLEVKSILDKEKKEHLNLTDLAKDIKPNSDKILIRQSEFMRQYQESVKIQKENAEIENNSGSNLEKKFIELNDKIDLHKTLKTKIDSQKPTQDQINIFAFNTYIQAKENDERIFKIHYLKTQDIKEQITSAHFPYENIKLILEEHLRENEPIYNVYFVEEFYKRYLDYIKTIIEIERDSTMLTKMEVDELEKKYKGRDLDNKKKEKLNSKKKTFETSLYSLKAFGEKFSEGKTK